MAFIHLDSLPTTAVNQIFEDTEYRQPTSLNAGLEQKIHTK